MGGSRMHRQNCQRSSSVCRAVQETTSNRQELSKECSLQEAEADEHFHLRVCKYDWLSRWRRSDLGVSQLGTWAAGAWLSGYMVRSSRPRHARPEDDCCIEGAPGEVWAGGICGLVFPDR